MDRLGRFLDEKLVPGPKRRTKNGKIVHLDSMDFFLFVFLKRRSQE